METSQQNSAARSCLLEKREALVAGMRVEYRLEYAGGYCITAEYGEESASVNPGQALEDAWDFFRMIVKHCVTPCTLEDVCADFVYLRAACGEEKNLYPPM